MNARAPQRVFVRFRASTARPRSSKPSPAFPGAPSASDARAVAPKTVESEKPTKRPGKRRRHERRNAEKVYFDPSNVSLDFTRPNHDLVNEIYAKSRQRSRLRLRIPAAEWEARHGEELATLRETTEKRIRGARVSLWANRFPLRLGDLVMLETHSTELYLVAAEPQSLASSLYMFVNSEGEIVQGPKHMIKLRIPRVLARHTVRGLSLISREKRHPGMPLVGVPVQGTHSSEIRGREEHNAPDSLPATQEDVLRAQAQTQLADNNEPTYFVTESARQAYLRYLRELSIEAFLKVTTYCSKLDHMHNVLQYDQGNNLITSVQTLPIFDLFSFVSQFGHTVKMNGQEGSRDAYRLINLQVRFPPGSGIPETCRFSAFALPKGKSAHYASQTHKVSSYIAFVIALLRSSRKWKINTQLSLKTPLSVDVLPVRKSQALDATAAFLKLQGGVEAFTEAYVAYVQDIDLQKRFDPLFLHVVQMLKDLVAENIVGDLAMESLAAKVVRSVDSRLGRRPGPAYSAEYSKSRAHDIIMSLSPDAEANPAYWREALAFPGTGTSRDADTFLRYFAYLDKEFSEGKLEGVYGRDRQGDTNETSVLSSEARVLGDGERVGQKTQTGKTQNARVASTVLDDFYPADPVAHVRADFGSTPVYCIDSATAHEIDDGVAIQEHLHTYRLSVHVANPTSYLKPDSVLSQIAFRKGATTYMPEGPAFMLPGLMSKMCGLGTGTKTRTLAIEYDLDKRLVDRCLAGDMAAADAASIRQQMEESAAVRFYHVTNFPAGYTYAAVNAVLAGDVQDNENALQEHPHAGNLRKLFHISGLLKRVRVQYGHGLLLDGESSRVSVQYADTAVPPELATTDSGYRIASPRAGASRTPVISIVQEKHQSHTAPAQQLVSELMIGANYAGTLFARRHNIPFIHRTQRLDLSRGAKLQLQTIMLRVYTEKSGLSVEETSQILSVMTSANFQVWRLAHDTLGVDMYLNLTSPLRRYIDMVNHWQLQAYVQDAPYMGEGDLDAIAAHLQTCEAIKKSATRVSETYWTGRFLEQYFALEPQLAPAERIPFSVLLRSDAKSGHVRAELVNFGAMRLTVVLDEHVRRRFALGDYYVGKVLQNVRFEVLKLDCIENDLTVLLSDST